MPWSAEAESLTLAGLAGKASVWSFNSTLSQLLEKQHWTALKRPIQWYSARSIKNTDSEDNITGWKIHGPAECEKTEKAEWIEVVIFRRLHHPV